MIFSAKDEACFHQKTSVCECSPCQELCTGSICHSGPLLGVLGSRGPGVCVFSQSNSHTCPPTFPSPLPCNHRTCTGQPPLILLLVDPIPGSCFFLPQGLGLTWAWDSACPHVLTSSLQGLCFQHLSWFRPLQFAGKSYPILFFLDLLRWGNTPEKM